MPDWSIKIVRAKNPKPDLMAEFLPDLSGSNPGDTLQVQQGDLISWNNTTGEAHRPWLVASQTAPPTDPPPNNNYLTLSNVQPNSASDAYNVGQPAGTTLYYCCKLHKDERACIVVVPFQASKDVPSA
jgi:hypothetical protein